MSPDILVLIILIDHEVEDRPDDREHTQQVCTKSKPAHTDPLLGLGQVVLALDAHEIGYGRA